MSKVCAFEALDQIQIEKISKFGKIISIPLDIIEACGGGSARCMMAEVHLPKNKSQHAATRKTYLPRLSLQLATTLYGSRPSDTQISIQSTRSEFQGDRTVVVFPFARLAGKVS